MSQRQGFNRYGQGLAVNEIVLLNDRAYQEERKVTLEALFANGVVGAHHLHSNGRVTVFDFRTVRKR